MRVFAIVSKLASMNFAYSCPLSKRMLASALPPADVLRTTVLRIFSAGASS